MRLPFLVASAVALASCQCRPPEGALRVVVRFGSFTPGCLRVIATAREASERTEIARERFRESSRATAAIWRQPEWSNPIRVLVQSFETRCEGSPLEEVRSAPIELLPGELSEWEATLVAADGDGDRWAAKSEGIDGSDCDDTQRDVHPEADEQCGSRDFDCDRAIGCADPDCSARCDGGLCARSCFPAGECLAWTGSCDWDGGCWYRVELDLPCQGDAGTCASDGGCVREEWNCLDTSDNDRDGLQDCFDPDCLGQQCSDLLPSTRGDQCLPDGGCVGLPYTCAAAPGECFDAGEPNGTDCSAPLVRAGLPCTGGVCLADGGCRVGAFSYLPSNFLPSQALPADSLDIASNCHAVFDSTGPDAGFTTTCQNWNPPVSVITLPGGDPAVLLEVVDFVVTSNSSIQFVGKRPVVVAAHGNVDLNGPVQASSVANRTGAGAGSAPCKRGQGSDGGYGSSGGGGGGAGFGTAGASGGDGGAAAGGDGGQQARLPPASLRGGCAGGAGGGVDAGQVAKGGLGGGALQISAAGNLKCDGLITASGSGGEGGRGAWVTGKTTNPGGGGGGSGGMLVLEGKSIELTSNCRLTANGGGGGGGAEDGSASRGADGKADSGTPAPGGWADGVGGEGGAGGTGGFAPEPGRSARAGGGGGGGAVGFIYLRRAGTSGACTISSAVESPPAQRVGCP